MLKLRQKVGRYGNTQIFDISTHKIENKFNMFIFCVFRNTLLVMEECQNP